MHQDGRASVHGYLGATSFASDFDEDSSPLRSEVTRSRPDIRISENDIRKGATCLSLLSDLPQYQPLIEKWNKLCPLSMVADWVLPLQSALERLVYDELSQTPAPDVEDFLYNASAQIWSNSRAAIEFDASCSMDEFSRRITDPGMRWESVGMYLNTVGLAVEALEYMEGSQIARTSFQARRELARTMLEASDLCISMCEKAGQLTDPETWLYLENFHLCSLIDGDASKFLRSDKSAVLTNEASPVGSGWATSPPSP